MLHVGTGLLVLVAALMAVVPAAQPRAPATTRSRSRSPPADRGQRCSIALGKEEVEELRRSKVVKRSWFGDRQDCVPVKPSLDMAVEAWKQADPANADRLPSHVLTFFVSLTLFQTCRRGSTTAR